ncbi:TolC family protein [Hallella colorans]|uniref:TolC family protein n=1 Tax=Hallella colorans TaxID=1703337 RepID=UPI00248EE548|nr:TolC family protein [Hallella colorans]
MKKSFLVPVFLSCFITFSHLCEAKVWTLQACVDYALKNNITLQKNNLKRLAALEDVKLSQAALLPSLSASTSQNATYNPWPETGSYMLAGSKVQSNVDKVYYNGSYIVSGNWTVWNGGRNRDQIQSNRLVADQAALDSATTSNSIQEQIASLYVQILYSKDAMEVSRSTLETSRMNESRGREFVKVGSMSKADLAQLVAQRAADEYALVQAESGVREYKRQLKRLLQITNQEDFDVVAPMTTDEMALRPIPDVPSVYDRALLSRPEIQSALLSIKNSALQIRMAKAQRLPTVVANAGLGTNTTSMSKNAWGTQVKTNFGVNGGFSVNVPIFDNRRIKTDISKAILSNQSYQLDLKDQQTNLYSVIENYWVQAVNNQAQFKSARVRTQSAQESYDLLSEQFRLKLKNTIELMNGKDALLKAQQAELQAKYLAILNIYMLEFYQSGKIV